MTISCCARKATTSRVVDVTLHAQPSVSMPCRIYGNAGRAHTGAEIPQPLLAGAGDEGRRAGSSLSTRSSLQASRWGNLPEASVEEAAVDQQAADDHTVAAVREFLWGVRDEVGEASGFIR